MTFYDAKWQTLRRINAIIENTDDSRELLECMTVLTEMSMDIDEAADNYTNAYSSLVRRITSSMRVITTKYEKTLEEVDEEEAEEVGEEEVDEEEEARELF